jgi:hypothetical protein
MPKKFISCVKKVKARQHGKDKPYNPYAVCRVSTCYYGPTRHIGLLHKMHKSKRVHHKKRLVARIKRSHPYNNFWDEVI